jgi:hypothetical protein
LKDEPDEDEVEELKSAKKKIDKAIVKMYINSGFQLIIYIITLWNLFSAL